MSSGQHASIRALTLIVCAAFFFSSHAAQAQVQVRHKEGLTHGFLVMRTLDGETIADGDLIQNVRGDRVTTHLVFHFKDGSLHDETAIFSQRGTFRLLSYHLIQKGPKFEHPMEVTINASTGEVIVRHTEDGKEKTESEHMKLPGDVANGMINTLLRNIPPENKETKVSMVAPTPKPKLVKLAITPQGEEKFSTGNASRKAMHYVLKVEIGGLTGAVATVIGKQPPDTHIWILEGDAPAFIRSEGSLALGAPVWRIELVCPAWPKTEEKPAEEKKGTEKK